MNTANPVQTPQIMEMGKIGGRDSNDSCEDARREKCFEAGASAMRSKRGRRFRYTAKQDLIILHDVAATRQTSPHAERSSSCSGPQPKRLIGTLNSP